MLRFRFLLPGRVVPALALAAAVLLGVGPGGPCAAEEGKPLPTAWWVWNRTAPLTADEVAALKRCGIQELQWNLGTLERKGMAWSGAEKLHLPPSEVDGLTILPVVRLDHAPATVEEPLADEALVALLARLCTRTRCPALQLDYDCPDRLLPRYADLLAKVRHGIAPVRLSVTALAGWPRVAGFKELAAAADELVPMFYDLESDAVAERRAPLLSEATVREQIPLWQACRTAWRAGLPNFTRLTVLDAQSQALGHVHVWHWETLVFDPALETVRPPTQGMTELRARTALQVGRTPVVPGGGLLVRWPELRLLQDASSAARAAGACGVVMFKLPQADSPSGWSLETVTRTLSSSAASERAPVAGDFVLQQSGQRLTLIHQGDLDLPPRFAAAAGERAAGGTGWTLELDVPPAGLAELSPGGFSGRDPARERLQGQVSLRFPHLRSGGCLSTGYFHIPHPPAVLRWRIPQISLVWQDAVPSP